MSKETRNRLHFKICINAQNSNTFRKKKKAIQVKLLFIIFVYSVSCYINNYFLFIILFLNTYK